MPARLQILAKPEKAITYHPITYTYNRGAMMKKLLLVLMLFLLVGCQRQGRIFHVMPQIADDNASQVVVARKFSLYSDLLLFPVEWDGLRVFELGIGEYTQFRIQPGTHTIRAKVPGFRVKGHTIEFKKGRTYYFLIRSTSAQRLEIDVIDNGEEIKSKYRYLPMQ